MFARPPDAGSRTRTWLPSMLRSPRPKNSLRHSLELIAFSLALAYAVFLAGSAFQARGSSTTTAASSTTTSSRSGRRAGWYSRPPGVSLRLGICTGRSRSRPRARLASYYGWHYPPPPLFLAAGLADPALSCGVGGVDGGHLARLCCSGARHLGERTVSLLGWASPVCCGTVVGQNGFLTAALIGGTLVCLERRPIVAGSSSASLPTSPSSACCFPSF